MGSLHVLLLTSFTLAQLGCDDAKPQPTPATSDASIAAAKQAQSEAMKQLAEANEALGVAAAAVQTALGKDVQATEQRAEAAKAKLASKDPKAQKAATAALQKVADTARTAKLAVAQLESTRAAQLQDARTHAQDALTAFQTATTELEALAGN